MEPPTSSPRYHELDTLRAAAMLLGIFFHAAISFLENPGIWPIRDRSYHPYVGLFVWASHGFRMQLFFLVAGFFARLLYERYGLMGFIQHRLRRIVLPLLAGIVFIVPLVHVVWIYGTIKAGTLTTGYSLGQSIVGYFLTGMYFTYINPSHLWFLYYLLFYYAGLLLLVTTVRPVVPQRHLDALGGLFARLSATPWQPLALALPTLLILYHMQHWGGVDEPGQSFALQGYTLLYYGLFFMFGWLLHRQPEALLIYPRYAWRYLAGGAVILAVIPFVLLQEPSVTHSYYGWMKLAALSLSALYSWLMVLGLLGLAKAYCSEENATIRYLSDAAYWLYLMHLPLVVYLQVLLADRHIFGPLKYLLINAVTLVILLLSYQYGVRYTWIGTMLNGPRIRPSPPFRSSHPTPQHSSVE
jgi:glucans biosynthesis protein C